MKRIVIPILLLLITFCPLTGSPSEGWRWCGDGFNYFAMWIGEYLGAILYYTTTDLYQCLMIRNGVPDECSLEELSILMYYY